MDNLYGISEYVVDCINNSLRRFYHHTKHVKYSQLVLYLYYSFDITEIRYKGSYINVLKALGENIHFDISGYFVITELDITGVVCTYNLGKGKVIL